MPKYVYTLIIILMFLFSIPINSQAAPTSSINNVYHVHTDSCLNSGYCYIPTDEPTGSFYVTYDSDIRPHDTFLIMTVNTPFTDESDIVYDVNGELLYSNTFPVYQNGTYTVTALLPDNLSVAPITVEINNIDALRPELTSIEYDKTEGISETTIIIAGDDPGDTQNASSGLSDMPFRFNQGEWTSDNTFTVNKNGKYTIEVRDNVGNLALYYVQISNLSNATAEENTATVTPGTTPGNNITVSPVTPAASGDDSEVDSKNTSESTNVSDDEHDKEINPQIYSESAASASQTAVNEPASVSLTTQSAKNTQVPKASQAPKATQIPTPATLSDPASNNPAEKTAQLSDIETELSIADNAVPAAAPYSAPKTMRHPSPNQITAIRSAFGKTNTAVAAASVSITFIILFTAVILFVLKRRVIVYNRISDDKYKIVGICSISLNNGSLEVIIGDKLLNRCATSGLKLRFPQSFIKLHPTDDVFVYLPDKQSYKILASSDSRIEFRV